MATRDRFGGAALVGHAAACVTLSLALVGCGLSMGRNEQPHQLVSEPKEVVQEDVAASGTVPIALDTMPEAGYVELGEGEGWYEEGISLNTEEYASLTEQGFVSAATRPLSTISSDVDTASYANLRRMLRDGYGLADIPDGAVRTEEMLNYFSYDYRTPAEKSDDLFEATVHVGDCPWNDQTKLVTVGFATAPEAAQVAEQGSNLVFLIDVSGSMDEPDKLDLLKEAFEELVDHLDENDCVSIVTYANGEEVVLDGAKGTEGRKIMRAIRRLRADGFTNGEAGLRMAYDLAKNHYIEGGVNRIVMASDGDLNVGITSESDLHDFVDAQRESGIYLSVLGFGSGNYKDTKMETLADHGNGSYHYIDCIEEAERVLGTNLMANLVPLADDVKVQVEFNPAQVKAYRLIGYENRAMADEDFANDERDAGDVGPNNQFTVAYEVALTDSELEVAATDLKYGTGATGDAPNGEWMTASVRYQPAAGGKVRQQEWAIGERDWQRDPGEDWRFQAGVIELAMLLRDSEYVGTADYDAICKLVGDPQADDRAEFLDLVDLALG